MKKILTALFVISFVFPACEEEDTPKVEDYEIIEPEDPRDKGDRLLGINISESSDGFMTSFETANEAGIQMLELNLPWSAMETSEGKYVDPYGGVLAATSFYGENDIKVCFSIALINTVQWEVPPYLEGVDPDDAAFIQAFKNFIDWFMAEIPDNVTVPAISIGNEVNYVLESNADWEKYTTFYETMVNYIHTNYPDVKVGVKTTIIGGLFTDDRDHIKALNAKSDVIMLNYYPQNSEFQVYAPTTIHEDFADMTEIFPTEEIWITEIGYQSGNDYCSSSESKQAEFYHEMFKCWDDHKDQVKFMLINWLHDQSPATIEEWKDYYGDDPALVEYLSTLGLRNYDGTDKAAWKQVKEEANSRNWK